MFEGLPGGSGCPRAVEWLPTCGGVPPKRRSLKKRRAARAVQAAPPILVSKNSKPYKCQPKTVQARAVQNRVDL